MEPLTGLGHVYRPDGLDDTLLSSRPRPWNSSGYENGGRNRRPKDGVPG